MAPAALPFLTADLPGTGGTIKAEPDHFIVEEVPLYSPAGHGEHLCVALTRSGRTTREVVSDLAAYLRVRPEDIGYAGLKD
ncbi:MAG: tRNA pseudouridine(13) synthase TruD, partial [Anaerolineae bacterium]|nr:tRNA pseudouridine(13) synthase TruD [Anaerolineae bacterium]